MKSEFGMKLTVRKILVFLSIGLFAATLTKAACAQFNLEAYDKKHPGQSKDQFITSFPYYTYLQQVPFTDFKTLQRHRQFVWQKYGDGDVFLYYLGDSFMQYYPVDIGHLTDTIAIGEAYLAEKRQIGINTASNEAYQIIGYYILSKVADKLKEDIRKGRFDPTTSANAALLQRLEQNRIYVPIEESGRQKLINNLKQGKWDYIVNRVWSKFKEQEQKASARYAAWLGDDFFTDYYPMQKNAPQARSISSRFTLSNFRRFYPIQSGRDYGVNILAMQENGKTNVFGHTIWLRRPQINSTYFAYQNVSSKFRQWAASQGKTVVLATTGGFTNTNRQPEGLTIENGQIVNAVLMPDRDGLVIISKDGGISVVNLKRTAIKLSVGTQDVLTIDNPLTSLIAYSKLLQWCREHRATLFQTQLLVYSDSLQIDPAKAKGQLRERRLLALARDQASAALYHVILDIPTQSNLAAIAKDTLDLFNSRGKKLEALLNLDVGSYNILQVFDDQRRVLPQPQGPVPIDNATNLIIYTR